MSQREGWVADPTGLIGHCSGFSLYCKEDGKPLGS